MNHYYYILCTNRYFNSPVEPPLPGTKPDRRLKRHKLGSYTPPSEKEKKMFCLRTTNVKLVTLKFQSLLQVYLASPTGKELYTLVD